jgi:hypothetical protein
MKQIEELIAYINGGFVSPEQAQFLLELVQMWTTEMVGKGELMELAQVPTKSGKVDTAYPHTYYDNIKQIYPSIRMPTSFTTIEPTRTVRWSM